MTHHVRFTRHTVTGETRCTCTCGYSSCADRETVTLTAEDHVRRGEEMRPLPPARFESGLAN